MGLLLCIFRMKLSYFMRPRSDCNSVVCRSRYLVIGSPLDGSGQCPFSSMMNSIKCRLGRKKEHFVMRNVKPKFRILFRTSSRFCVWFARVLLIMSSMQTNAKGRSRSIASIICWNMTGAHFIPNGNLLYWLRVVIPCWTPVLQAGDKHLTDQILKIFSPI